MVMVWQRLLWHMQDRHTNHMKNLLRPNSYFLSNVCFEMIANDAANPLKCCSCTMYQKDNLCPGFVLKMFDHVNKLQCWSSLACKPGTRRECSICYCLFFCHGAVSLCVVSVVFCLLEFHLVSADFLDLVGISLTV